MSPDERKRLVRIILDQHAEAMRAFRYASDAFDKAITGMRDTLPAVHDANHAQGQAINRMIAANQAALTLSNDE